MSALRSFGALRALLLASAILLFVDVGASTIWDANEAFYVETPRQMVLTGDYVNPSFNGAPRFNKPVLNYWIVAGFYNVLGVSVTSERLAIAVGALMLVFATFVIGRTLGGTNAGVAAALVLASAPRVMLWSRRIFIDIYFASFLALALMCFVLAYAHPARRRLALIGMYVAIGLAMLTKGPVAIILPGCALVVWLLWTAGASGANRIGAAWAEVRRMMVPVGILIVLAIVLPWYVADYQQNGWEHIRKFFIGENFDRYTDTVGVQNRPVWFYIPVLLSDLTPWSLMLPAALVCAWQSRRRDQRLMIVWIAVFAGVFSLSKTKQDLYIFPAATAIAALIGVLIDRMLTATVPRVTSLLARGGTMLTAFLMVAFGALIIYVTKSVDLPGAAIAGGVLIVGGCVAFALSPRGSFATVVLTLGGSAVIVNWLLVLLVMRPFEQYKPVAPLSEWLRAHTAPTTVVAHYKTILPSMAYYLGRPYTEVFDLQTMLKLVDANAPLYVLLRPGDFNELRAATSAPMCVVDRRTLPLFDAKLKEVLSGNPPQIWLAAVNTPCQ